MKRAGLIIVGWILSVVAAATVVYVRMKAIQDELWRFAMKNDSILKVLDYWLELKGKGITVAENIKKHGYKNIAIYGYGVLGQRLYSELEGLDISITYIVDKNADQKVGDVPVISADSELPDTDVLIVTAIGDYRAIREKMLPRVKCPIVSLEDVIYGE